MAIVVQKFGGTSVATPERIMSVAQRIVNRKRSGDKVVAVVSAMGKTTDELVGLAAAVNENPPTREMDRLLSTGEQVSMSLLAMAIDALGCPAMSFTGRQAGIVTDNTHNKAKIVSVDSERILEALDAGFIPVVAGFQGIDKTSFHSTFLALYKSCGDCYAVDTAYPRGPGRTRLISLSHNPEFGGP